jgi:hypothetical protein
MRYLVIYMAQYLFQKKRPCLGALVFLFDAVSKFVNNFDVLSLALTIEAASFLLCALRLR